MVWFRRKPAKRREVSGPGVIVVDTTKQHRCQPPGAYEWPAGRWKVDEPRRYPEGTVWRCGCGLAWESSRWAPGYSLHSDSNGLWLNWYRNRKHDADPAPSGHIGASDG